MWRWAGDTATDYNYYSKRLILAADCFNAALLVDDDSEDFVKTGFLERRIENVMQFEKVKADARIVRKNSRRQSTVGLIGALAKCAITRASYFRAETGHMAHFCGLRLAVKMHE